MSERIEVRRGQSVLRVAASRVAYWAEKGFTPVEPAKPAAKRATRRKVTKAGDE